MLQKIENLQRLICFINKGCTGCPNKLCKQLGISRRCLYDYIDTLKSEGVEVRYSRKNGTFYYANSKRLKINIQIEVTDLETQNIWDTPYFRQH